jgi:hypothetical protein
MVFVTDNFVGQRDTYFHLRFNHGETVAESNGISV